MKVPIGPNDENFVCLIGLSSHSKVDQIRLTRVALEQNIARLEICMNDILLVKHRERASNLRQHIKSYRGGKRRRIRDRLLETFDAPEELNNLPVLPVGINANVKWL
jgi:hypothetical protein